MTIDYSEDGKVKFTMYDYLEDILEESPEDMKGTTRTVASDHLFTVNPECTKLNPETADYYHRTVARMLFASKRARPDLQTAVAFLCTRVAAPDDDDYKKLKKVIQYIETLSICHWYLDGTNLVCWCGASMLHLQYMRKCAATRATV
jgi:hypothetical protein